MVQIEPYPLSPQLLDEALPQDESGLVRFKWCDKVTSGKFVQRAGRLDLCALNRYGRDRTVSVMTQLSTEVVDGGGAAADASADTFTSQEARSIDGRKIVLTWNVASINNNPLEYIINFDVNPTYRKMMMEVERVLASPAPAISEVFTDEMFQTLLGCLATAGTEPHELDALAEFWAALRDRDLIDGFLKHPEIGAKRLISMPDRVSNTIHTVDGSRRCRPAVINAYVGAALIDRDSWLTEWLAFIFGEVPDTKLPPKAKGRNVYSLFKPLSPKKYPAVTESESAVSRPLQALYLAVFDCVMIHVLTTAVGTDWLPVKRQLCEALIDGKNERTLQVLKGPSYKGTDILCLQEVSVALVSALRTEFGAEYYVIAAPDASAELNQNSVILLRRSAFKDWRDTTSAIVEQMGDAAEQLGPGDVVAATCTDHDDRLFIVVSFHGDSDGRSSLPVTRAVAAVGKLQPSARLIFGADLNMTRAGKNKLHFSDFMSELPAMGLESTLGSELSADNYTCFQARSYLQPQLQKAVPFMKIHEAAAKEPKDTILISPEKMKCIKCWKDSVGDGSWVEDQAMPSASFPSDHAIIAALLVPQ